MGFLFGPAVRLTQYFVPIGQEAVSVFETLRAKPEVTLIGYDATRFHGVQHGEPTWGIDIKPHDLATVWEKWESKSSKVKTEFFEKFDTLKACWSFYYKYSFPF